jgi:hypothetical protein
MSGVWAWLATPSADGGGLELSDEEKAIEIQKNGFNPEDFNLYTY